VQKNYFGLEEVSDGSSRTTGCSKRLSSKAAASEGPRRTLGVR